MAEFGESRLENVVEYKIFNIHLSDVENKHVTIEDILCDVLSFAQSIIGDYIWQNGCFNLTCEELEKAKEMEHLENMKFLKGSTNFGDNIEDEWFIVYLLFSITKQFPQLVATVNDNDGEFLLIEAAEYLPKWLEPDTSENRVFIYQGNLHILPLPSKPSEITIFPTGKPSIYNALKTLKTNAEKTLALPWIQDPIMNKIQEYPKKARECFHNVLCYVPPKVKYLLETKKSLISPVVLAFVNRDPVDVKTCQKLTHFTLESLVPFRVQFTKCLYGQLVKQNFIPDISGMKFLPELTSSACKGHLVGLQLTYGFEILYNQQSGCTTTTANTATGQQWEKYLRSLTKHGYFQNEVVGSQLYTQLLENAKEYFTRICMNSDQNENISNEIKQLLEVMPQPEEGSVQSDTFPPDDDESWLEVSPEELDSILSQYCQAGISTGEDLDLRQVVNGMNSFVETISSYEGAEFPAELSDKSDIQFDPEGFIKSIDRFFTPSADSNENETTSDEELYSSDASGDEELDAYTSAMDKELSLSNVGKSFVKVEEKTGESQTCSNKEYPDQTTEEDAKKPVDIDLNLVQNFLESYSLQEGLPGPVSNIFNSMGIKMPENLPN